MARPKSEDKRNAILAAASQVIAEQGESAPTARIAKLAGVAEGTLFTYFSNKDELLNELYLALKSEFREVMMSRYPSGASAKDRIRHAWQIYVAWGVANPEKRKVMAQLSMSERLTEQSRQAGRLAFPDLNAIIAESTAKGALRDRSPAFGAAIMGALAETTMDFMARYPAEAEGYSASGFDALWNAISK